MKLEKILIHKMGVLENKEIELDGNFNFFIGKNERGKSTFVNSIKALIFGFDSIKNNPYSKGGSEIKIEGKFDEFSITRKLASKKVESYISDENLNVENIANYPVKYLNKNLMNLMFVTSEEMFFDNDNFNEKVEPILDRTFGNNYNSVSKILDNYSDDLKSLYTKSSISKRKINILKSEYDSLESTLSKYRLEEQDLNDDILKLEEIREKNFLIKQEIETKQKEIDEVINQNRNEVEKLIEQKDNFNNLKNKYYKGEHMPDYPMLDVIFAFLSTIIAGVLLKLFNLPIYVSVLWFLLFMGFTIFRYSFNVKAKFFLSPISVIKLKDMQKIIVDNQDRINELYSENEKLNEENNQFINNKYKKLNINSLEKSNLEHKINSFYNEANFSYLEDKKRKVKEDLDKAISRYKDLLIEKLLLEYSSKKAIEDTKHSLLRSAVDYFKKFTNNRYLDILIKDSIL